MVGKEGTVMERLGGEDHNGLTTSCFSLSVMRGFVGTTHPPYGLRSEDNAVVRGHGQTAQHDDLPCRRSITNAAPSGRKQSLAFTIKAISQGAATALTSPKGPEGAT